MGKRKTPSRGPKPDKLMRDALAIELKTYGKDGRGKKTKKLRIVARKLVDQGMAGNITAIKEIYDRMDGRKAQPNEGADGEGLRHRGDIDWQPRRKR